VAQQLRERINKQDYMNLKAFSAQQKKWSLNGRGHSQNGRKPLPAIIRQGTNSQNIQSTQKAKLPKNE
jgi:hypothetical protein